MLEIVNFKMGATIIKFSATVKNLNAQGILMPAVGEITMIICI
jgi:hypothetical protein